MQTHSWVDNFPGAVTVCDTTGIILEMNEAAAQTFKKEGGLALIGSNLLDCHPEPARSKLKHLMDSQQRNVYTIEKAGRRKLIYQSPWYQDGRYAGMVELSLELPPDMPHFVRDRQKPAQADQS